MKKILSVFLSFAIICALIPMNVIAENEDLFSVYYEVHKYTPSEIAPEYVPGTIDSAIVDTESEALEVGDKIAVAVKMKNISTITDIGIESVGWDLLYDPEYLTPLFTAVSVFDSLTVSVNKNNGAPYNTSYDLGAQSTTQSNGLVRVYITQTSNAQQTSETVLNSDFVLGWLIFEAKKSGTTNIYSSPTDTQCMVNTFPTTDYSGGDDAVINTVTTLTAVNKMDSTGIPNQTLTIADYSDKPIVTENKTYDAQGALESTSTLAVSKLDDGVTEGGVDIPANTKITLYSASASVVTDAETSQSTIELTRGDEISSQTTTEVAETVTFTLNGTGDTATSDYIMTATEDGKDESKDVPVKAATAVLAVEDDWIVTAYDTSNSTFAADSNVRIYSIGGTAVDANTDSNTVIKLYDSNDDGAEAVKTVTGDDKVQIDGVYCIPVSLSGMDSTKTYYVTATEYDRDESPVKYSIRKQSYMISTEAGDIEVVNNSLKTPAEADTILVKQVILEDGTKQAISGSAEIKVYESDSETAAALSGVTQELVYDGENQFVGIKVSLPAGTMTEDGRDLWITSTETLMLESSKVKVTAPQAGGEIIALVASDGTLIGAEGTLTDYDKEKLANAIANGTGSAVPPSIVIPAGTTSDNYASYGFPTDNVAVYLKEAADETGGVQTQIAFVNFDSWDYADSIGATAAVTNGTSTQDYTVTGTVNADSLTSAGLALSSGYTPQVTATVTTDSVITGLDPNLEEGENTVINPVTVQENTKKTDLPSYGLADSNIAVVFTPAKTVDGEEVTTATVGIVWDYSSLPETLTIPEGQDSADYDLYGSFDADDLAAAGLAANDFVYKPHTVVHVIKGKVGTGVVTPEGDIVPTPQTTPTAVTEEELDDIKTAGGNGFETEIVVASGTTVAEAKAKFPTEKIPVYVTETASDGTISHSIAYIDASYDYSALPTGDSTALTTDEGEPTKTYIVQGTLDASQLTAEDITLSSAVDLKVTLIVANVPEITLNNGNTTADDITAGRAASDIFVFRGYTFTDPGFTVKMSDGTDVTLAEITAADDGSKGVIKREYKVKDADGDYTALGAFVSSEKLSVFNLAAGTDYSKTYELKYTYTDPTTGLEATASRTVYVIYQRGDVDRGGNIGSELTLNDFQTIKNHVYDVKYLVETDDLYMEKTADIDKQSSADGKKITLNDFQSIKNHVYDVKKIEQDYAADSDYNMIMN